MQEQLSYLGGRDERLKNAIETIQAEELQHLHFAETHCRSGGAIARVLDALIAGITEVVIWLSTWGEVTRMRKELTAHAA
jgi:ubiquinone biosynthesis monooxygenase Coq7